MLRITNFNVPFDHRETLAELAAKRLKVDGEAIRAVRIARRSVDARRYRQAPIQFIYTLDVDLSIDERVVAQRLRRDAKISIVNDTVEPPLARGAKGLEHRPVVVGFGPAGMFAAYNLAKYGYRPLVLERGHAVGERSAAIERFWRSGELSPQSNVQFGEGGAGTFSDGKLTARSNDSASNMILEVFVAAGAPPEIKYLHKPHIGTDNLRRVVKNIREQIIAWGGEVRFDAQVTDIAVKDGALSGVTVNGDEFIPCEVALFGIGHSARDTYAMLYDKQVAMEAKAFAIGARIEHPQDWIDQAQYGVDAGHERLGAADYALTYQDRESGRGAYSFCMCPGGAVIAAASSYEQVVVNGMSNYRRDSGVANSALLVTVGPRDFGSGVLDGIALQNKCEKAAYLIAGANYNAPVQSVGDFLAGRKGSRDFIVAPTYRPGVTVADLHDCLPDYVTAVLAKALPHFGGKLKGFADPGAALTGVETRSSSPCRILRGGDYNSVNVGGLYPVGEGAGYAGGIMSAALDGWHAASAVIGRYCL